MQMYVCFLTIILAPNSLELVRYADLIASVFDYAQHIHLLVLFAERETGGSASEAADKKRKKTKLFGRNKGGMVYYLRTAIDFMNIYVLLRNQFVRNSP